MKEPLPKSIFELIDSENFRKRTAMYLVEKSISNLRIFMDGYRTCEWLNQISSEKTKPPFWMFYNWICKYYNHSGSYYSWDGIILQNSENEAKALDTFFERFDEFRNFKPQKLITANVNKNDIDYFNSHKGIRWRMEDGQRMRIGPAEKLFIIEYDKELGCSSHHRKNEKGITSGYFESFDKAIEDAEREYGKSLIWNEVSKDEIESVYEKII